MLTQRTISHIIYDDLRNLGIKTYIKYHLPDEKEETETRIEEGGRIVIRPKFIAADKTYFNDCTIEVNIAFPDIGGEASPKVDDLCEKAFNILNNDKCGEKDGEFYRYHVQRYSVEDEPNLKCHYANLTILFEILNVRRN